jgi:hypothetical protein
MRRDKPCRYLQYGETNVNKHKTGVLKPYFQQLPGTRFSYVFWKSIDLVTAPLAHNGFFADHDRF